MVLPTSMPWLPASTVTDNLEASLDQSLLVGPSSALYTFLISLSGAMIGLYAVDIAADDNSVSWSAAFWLLFAAVFISLCLELIRRRKFDSGLKDILPNALHNSDGNSIETENPMVGRGTIELATRR